MASVDGLMRGRRPAVRRDDLLDPRGIAKRGFPGREMRGALGIETVQVATGLAEQQAGAAVCLTEEGSSSCAAKTRIAGKQGETDT